ANKFEHIQAAHCENGVTTNPLRHIGVKDITEPLAFGIGSGLFFIYIPFMKINHGPATAFRTLPGAIFARTCKSLGIPVVRKKFNSKEKRSEERRVGKERRARRTRGGARAKAEK